MSNKKIRVLNYDNIDYDDMIKLLIHIDKDNKYIPEKIFLITPPSQPTDKLCNDIRSDLLLDLSNSELRDRVAILKTYGKLYTIREYLTMMARSTTYDQNHIIIDCRCINFNESYTDEKYISFMANNIRDVCTSGFGYEYTFTLLYNNRVKDIYEDPECSYIDDILWMSSNRVKVPDGYIAIPSSMRHEFYYSKSGTGFKDRRTLTYTDIFHSTSYYALMLKTKEDS